MKHPILKSALVLSAAIALMNCGEETSNVVNGISNQIPNASENGGIILNPGDGNINNIVVSEPCWALPSEQGTLIIGTNFVVTDITGAPVGTYDPATQTVVGAAGDVVMQGVDYTQLPILLPSDATPVTPDEQQPSIPNDPSIPSGEQTVPGTTTPSTTPSTNVNQGNPNAAVSSAVVPSHTSSSSKGNSNNQQAASSSSVKENNQNQPASSSSVQQGNAAGVTVSGNLTQTVAPGAQTSKISFSGLASKDEVSRDWKAYFLNESFENGTYTISPSTIPDHFAGQTVTETFTIKGSAYKFTITVSGGNNNNQNNQQQQSSSSKQQKSSSSVAKSSSSKQQKSSSSQQQWQQPSSSSQQQNNQQQGGASLLPKIIDNNKKTGYATRYWDSCKPHCAWEGKGGPVARTCNADGMSKANSGASSVCDGGNAGTCFDQTPQIVNDTIAYAFAATPGGGSDCGKCYMLTFKGTGASATNTPTDDHHRKIKGKHLIVMSSNIGYDVSHNQFDLMIPGGGPGAFNGCGKMGISCAGAQYGGFLTTCNYDKSCLIEMCNSEYSNESLRNGCLFLANWMDAANNPEIEFVQVECPAALAAKY